MTFVIFKHGLISECARVTIETKIRRNSGSTRHAYDSGCSQPNTNGFSPSPKHHIKREPRHWRFFLLRTLPVAEIFGIVFPADRQLEPEKSAGEHGATLYQDSQQRNHNLDARRPPAPGQCRRPRRVSANPGQSA